MKKEKKETTEPKKRGRPKKVEPKPEPKKRGRPKKEPIKIDLVALGKSTSAIKKKQALENRKNNIIEKELIKKIANKATDKTTLAEMKKQIKKTLLINKIASETPEDTTLKSLSDRLKSLPTAKSPAKFEVPTNAPKRGRPRKIQEAKIVELSPQEKEFEKYKNDKQDLSPSPTKGKKEADEAIKIIQRLMKRKGSRNSTPSQSPAHVSSPLENVSPIHQQEQHFQIPNKESELIDKLVAEAEARDKSITVKDVETVAKEQGVKLDKSKKMEIRRRARTALKEAVKQSKVVVSHSGVKGAEKAEASELKAKGKLLNWKKSQPKIASVIEKEKKSVEKGKKVQEIVIDDAEGKPVQLDFLIDGQSIWIPEKSKFSSFASDHMLTFSEFEDKLRDYLSKNTGTFNFIGGDKEQFDKLSTLLPVEKLQGKKSTKPKSPKNPKPVEPLASPPPTPPLPPRRIIKSKPSPPSTPPPSTPPPKSEYEQAFEKEKKEFIEEKMKQNHSALAWKQGVGQEYDEKVTHSGVEKANDIYLDTELKKISNSDEGKILLRLEKKGIHKSSASIATSKAIASGRSAYEEGEITDSDEEGRGLDFEHIKWGSLTKQFEIYKKNHNIHSLEEFAHYILSHPNEFKPRTRKRASFYTNVIKGKGLNDGDSDSGSSSDSSDSDDEPPRKISRHNIMPIVRPQCFHPALESSTMTMNPGAFNNIKPLLGHLMVGGGHKHTPVDRSTSGITSHSHYGPHAMGHHHVPMAIYQKHSAMRPHNHGGTINDLIHASAQHMTQHFGHPPHMALHMMNQAVQKGIDSLHPNLRPYAEQALNGGHKLLQKTIGDSHFGDLVNNKASQVYGGDIGHDLASNLAHNVGRLANTGTNYLIKKSGVDDSEGTGIGDDLARNLAHNTARLANTGTNYLIKKSGVDDSEGKMAGTGPKGLKKFNKWMGAIGDVAKSVGDYIKPVAQPILEAGTKQAVNNINAYGNANANEADPYGAVMGRGGEIGDGLYAQGSGRGFKKGSPEAKAHMAKIRAMRGKGMPGVKAKRKELTGGEIPAPPSRSPVTDVKGGSFLA